MAPYDDDDGNDNDNGNGKGVGVGEDADADADDDAADDGDDDDDDDADDADDDERMIYHNPIRFFIVVFSVSIFCVFDRNKRYNETYSRPSSCTAAVHCK